MSIRSSLLCAALAAVLLSDWSEKRVLLVSRL